MSTELHVLYASSDAYAVPAGVSIYSLLKNNQHIESLYIHLVSDGIRSETMEKLDRIAADFGREIDYIDGKEISDRLERYGCAKYNGTYTTYYKLFALPVIRQKYPKIKTLAYIDSDTVVTGPLDGLADLDMGENDISCVYELNLLRGKKRLNIAPSEQVINAGVCIIDVGNWETHGVEDKIIALLQDREYAEGLLLAEQDIFNSKQAAAIQRLPVKYNMTTFNYYLRPTSKFVRRFKIGPGFYSDEEVEEAVKNPVIVHYLNLTMGRPWDKPNANPFTGLYEQYKAECWPDGIMQGAKRGFFKKTVRYILIWMYRHLPMSILGDLTSLILWLLACWEMIRYSRV